MSAGVRVSVGQPILPVERRKMRERRQMFCCMCGKHGPAPACKVVRTQIGRAQLVEPVCLAHAQELEEREFPGWEKLLEAVRGGQVAGDGADTTNRRTRS